MSMSFPLINDVMNMSDMECQTDFSPKSIKFRPSQSDARSSVLGFSHAQNWQLFIDQVCNECVWESEVLSSSFMFVLVLMQSLKEVQSVFHTLDAKIK